MVEEDLFPGMRTVTAEDVASKAAGAAFGKPLVTNNLRALLVEAMIDIALAPVWRWCAADYAGWDFQHESGTKLEVKQSAARQTWTTATGGPSKSSFDIAARTGYWVDGATWMPGIGRNADIYVLAHHPVEGVSADHRDPNQWNFYVVAAAALPDTKSISLARVRCLCSAVSFGELGQCVESVRQRVNSG